MNQLISKKDNEIDISFSSMNNLSQLGLERILFTLNPLLKIISIDDTEVIPAIPIIMNSLILLILIYSILTLLLIAIIWLIIRKRIWDA